MTEASGSARFSCTPDGVVARGQRRLARVFGLLGMALLVAAVFAVITRQFLAGALVLALALGVFIIHRMSRELEPTELVILSRGQSPGQSDGQGARLAIMMRHAVRQLPLEDASARRLASDEIEHLAGLTSSGGFVAGAGGFDSHLLGEFDLYASRLENAILVETQDGRAIITPDDPESFLEALGGVARHGE